MSLKDTIDGARKEAAEAGSLRPGQPKGDEAEDAAEERKGFSKRSVSRAKPAREKSSGVRVVSSTGRTVSGGKAETEMTKEEKKARKAERRDREDRRAALQQAILRKSGAYRKGYKLWWILLGIAVGVTVVSWLLVYYFPDDSSNYQTPVGMVALLTMIVAYTCIIVAFVYDWRKVRPMRKQAEGMVAGMSDKKVNQMLVEDAQEREREQAEAEKAKAARKAQRSGRHEQHK